MAARVLALNASTGQLFHSSWWQRQGLEMGDPRQLQEGIPAIGHRLDSDYPWFV